MTEGKRPMHPEVIKALENLLQGRTMLEFYDYVCEMSDVDNLARKKVASLPDNRPLTWADFGSAELIENP